jgi:alkylhydroperoxidase family enzyme
VTTRTEAERRLDEWADAALANGDRDLLERCAAIMARTLGAGTATWPVLRADWWADPDLDDRERAVIALTEQWLVDVSSIDDEHIHSLLEHLDPAQVLGVLMGLVAIEQRMRVRVALDRLGVHDR